MIGVERIDEWLGGIRGALELGGFFSGLLFDHLVAVEFAEPEAFLDHVHGQFSACSDFTDRERGGFAGDGQGVGGAVTGDDTPEEVGIGVVIQLAGELVEIDDELAGDFGGLGDEGDIMGEVLLQVGE